MAGEFDVPFKIPVQKPEEPVKQEKYILRQHEGTYYTEVSLEPATPTQNPADEH